MTNCSALKLTNDEVNTGAYAWIMCSSPSVDCQQLLRQVNIIGTSGVDCGATKQGSLGDKHIIYSLYTVLSRNLFTDTFPNTCMYLDKSVIAMNMPTSVELYRIDHVKCTKSVYHKINGTDINSQV